VSDQWSNKTVIALAGPLFLCCPIGWTLAVLPAPHALTLPILVVLQLVLGAALAGLDLAGGNIVLKLAPRGEATVFLGANGLFKSLCAGCAPIVGGFLIDHLTALELPFLPAWAGSRILGLHPWSFFFLATALLGVLALMRLSPVEESGDVRLGVVFAAARRAVIAALRTGVTAGVARAAPTNGHPIGFLYGEATPCHASERALRDVAIGLPANDGNDLAALARAIDAKRGGLRRAG
jgi:MFS family permease